MERGIGSGDLPPGHLLPPQRELAASLGVNPNTVAAAYRTLRERGLIETAGRRGSRVRHRPASTSRDDTVRVHVPPGARDISDGNPDPALLPPLGPALAAAGERFATAPPMYGAPPVSERLAAAARAELAADGVQDAPLTVASGSLDAIERVLAAHLRPGDAVAVEDPGWGSLLDLVPALGLRALPMTVDDEGPLPGDAEQALERGARALVVTARAQNPTGAAVTAQRAAALRAVLAAHPQTLLIEDDHGHHIVDLPLHTLTGVTRHWAFVRSAAKAYGPDLRVAVLTGDDLTVDRVGGRHRLGPGWVSHLLQETVAGLWHGGAVDPVAVAASYGRRREALLTALADRGVLARGRSGMNVWVPAPEETGAVAGLLTAGWAVGPGARFRLASPPGIRLTVSALGPADIAPLADAVAAALTPGAVRRYD